MRFSVRNKAENSNFKPLALLSGCTARFVSDLVENVKTGFLASKLICNMLINVIRFSVRILIQRLP